LAVDQTSATTPPAAPAQSDEAGQPTDAATSTTSADSRPVGFGTRGRIRRRARFLRKARELAYRDLGGLVYSLHRFGQRNDSLVLAKLATLTRIDAELRGLEASLSERHAVTVLREAGITACPRCAAIHSGEDRFCPNCGLPMSRNVDLLADFQSVAGAQAATAAPGAAGVPASAVAAGAPAAAAAPAPQAEPSSGATASFAPVPAPQPAPSPPPAGAAAGPAGAPAPAWQPAPSAPATQTHPVTPPPGGRSPVPPVPAKAPSPAPASDDDQPTEIIRPPAAGS
jgi:hypothetical protein